MTDKTVEFSVNCKRCEKPIGYSGMMFEKMEKSGQSRPEYCESCRKILASEKMTMGAAYYSLETVPGVDLTEAIPGELGKVYHPDRPHVKKETEKTFDETKFGATPGKIVEIYNWLKSPKHQVVIVKGGTGSGKSTALPYWLIFPPEGVPKDFFTRDGQIAITQPRIVATTGVSKYLGSLLGSSVGKGFDIGYRYSKDRNADRFNAAFMATDGTLINMIKMGQLSELSVVMIDEAHERSLNIDIILHLLKDQLPLYPHLKLLIVSATINAESFLEYFGKETATLVEFEPKSKFTYVENYADEKDKLSYDDPRQLKKQLVPALVKKVVWLLNEEVEGRKPRGHVLAFLQGVKPIEDAVTALRAAVLANPKMKDQIEIFPLYSDLSEEDTDRAIGNTDTKKIKVIVSTNVAEASITVEGVVYVIESGVENQAQWEVEETKKMIELRLISKANARQRWGRSGRTRNGEVFCLYTKKQFDAMLDFPIPAIQRSSMDEIILKLKELGIDDYDKDWIDAPVGDELKRSVASLKGSGAIDGDDMLTEYGALLSKFQYPASLADLVIMADRFGCAVEIATILPIIKVGGFRSFLAHDTSWDEPTKQRAENVQKVLWQGCKDDVEFIFRMFSFWQNPPDAPGDKGDSKKIIASRRDDWAKAFYVNFEMFDDGIVPEREKIMQLLSAHRKDRNTRNLEFDLLERVRMVLAFSIPFVPVTDSYNYNPRLVVKSGGDACCQLSIPADRVEKILTLRKQNASPIKLALDSMSWGEGSESLESVLKRLLTAPVLPASDTKLFEAFVSKYKVGDELSVDVIGYTEHSGDFRISLTIKDPETGYEAWLTPSDISFTQSSAVVKQIPVGTKLRVCVKTINTGKKFVQLSCLPLVEVELEKSYSQQRKVDGKIIARAKVIDVRNDKKVIFIAEMSRPAEGFVMVIHANENVLGKPSEDFKVGDVCLVSFVPDTGFEYKSILSIVSDGLRKYFSQQGSRLGWKDGRLVFKGKMKYVDLVEFAKLDNDPAYLAALDYLYLASNMNWASRVNDSGWIEIVKKNITVGQLVEVTIKSILSSGVLVELPNDKTGFVSAGAINPFRLVNNLQSALKVGERYKAKVVGFNEERQQVNLSLSIPENGPLVRFKKGQQLDGFVYNITKYGAFVNLSLGYSGLIYVLKMPPSLKVGDFVRVEILDVSLQKNEVRISLGFKSVLK